MAVVFKLTSPDVKDIIKKFFKKEKQFSNGAGNIKQIISTRNSFYSKNRHTVGT